MADERRLVFHIETVENAFPDRVTQSLFLETLVASAHGLRRMGFSLSRPAAESLSQYIQMWLADTEGEVPPKQ